MSYTNKEVKENERLLDSKCKVPSFSLPMPRDADIQAILDAIERLRKDVDTLTVQVNDVNSRCASIARTLRSVGWKA